MARIEITTYGNPVLREKAEKIDEINDEIKNIAKKLEKRLESENGIGLAAPQIGISKRIFTVDLTKAEMDKKTTLINPKIIYKSTEVTDYEEGCLSIPEVWGKVIRPSSIKIKGTLINGRTIVLEADGLFARVLQHEFDHLDGKLFIDYLSETDLKINQSKLDALVEKNRKKLGKVAL